MTKPFQTDPSRLVPEPSEKRNPAIYVVCMKWGTRYPSSYVNRLARAVAANLAVTYQFVCMTDDAAGLLPEIKAVPFLDFPLPREQWGRGFWAKLMLFSPAAFPEGSVVLYLDLDVMVIGDLTPFVEAVMRKQGLWIIREWHPSITRLLPVAWRSDRGGNSSVVGWVAGQQTVIWDAFLAAPDDARANWRSDQGFISDRAVRRHYWPYRSCASFRRHCVYYWPLSLLFRHPKRPDWTRVIVFHGRPDPTDLIGDDPRKRWGKRHKYGFGPVSWVQEYWRRYSEAAAQ